MSFRMPILALAALALTTAPAAAQDAGEVAGRPALTTTTAQDLIAQRDKWGSAPSAAKPAAAAAAAAAAPAAKAAAKPAAKEPPPPGDGKAAKAAIAAATTYAVLPTDSVTKLIAERETWGKGPKGYETKKVAAPLAAGAPKSLATGAGKAAKAAPAKAAKAAPAKAAKPAKSSNRQNRKRKGKAKEE